MDNFHYLKISSQEKKILSYLVFILFISILFPSCVGENSTNVRYKDNIVYIEKEFEMTSSQYKYGYTDNDMISAFAGKIYKAVNQYKNLKGIHLKKVFIYEDDFGNKKKIEQSKDFSVSDIERVRKYKNQRYFEESEYCLFWVTTGDSKIIDIEE